MMLGGTYLGLDDMELLSLTCVVLAAKFLECRAPGLKDLSAGSQRLSAAKLRQMELEVLKVLDWQINVETPHVICQQLLQKLHRGTDRGSMGSTDWARLQHYANYFIDLSIFGTSYSLPRLHKHYSLSPPAHPRPRTSQLLTRHLPCF